MQSLSLKIYAICVVVLFFKMILTGVMQAATRTKLKVFTNPEDAKSFGGDSADKEHPDVDRFNRAFRNDFENIPAFLALGGVFVALGCWETGALIYFPIFALARVSHTICYVKSIQPFRSISFGIGLLCSFGLAIGILYKVLFG